MKAASMVVVGLGAFLLGCCVMRNPTPAWAGETDAARSLIAVTTSVDNNREVVWLIDADRRMMALYDANRGEAIRLVAVRNFEWDFSPKILDYPKGSPSPTAGEMKKMFEEKEKPADGEQAAKPGK